MNQYERENVDRIINEIKEMEKSKEMSVVEKAYYVYRKLGDIYQYKINYMYADELTYKSYLSKIEIYREGTNEKGEAICIDMNRTYIEALDLIGIKAHLMLVDERNPLSHTDVCFRDEEDRCYYTNLTSDIMHIKTGMKIRNFGLSEKQLKNKLYDENPKKNRMFYLHRMHEENEGKEFTSVSEEQIKQWDDETNYTYQGLYTDEVLDMLAKEMLDDEFVSGFFGTNKKDELVQKKLEFIMQKLEIVNIHKKKKIGDKEAIDYYKKIARKIFSIEQNQYLNYYAGFIEKNGVKEARDIVVIKKEEENVYYLYNSESHIFEKIDKEKLLKQPIKHYTKENEEEDISVTINRLEKRLEEAER